MPRILVVEDDHDLQFLYNTMLARQGYEIVSTERTGDAMLYLTHEDFDLVILDMNMPDMPGIRLIEFAREDVRLRHIPIMVISANNHWEKEVFALGVRNFLVKPVKLKDLVNAIGRVLVT